VDSFDLTFGEVLLLVSIMNLPLSVIVGTLLSVILLFQRHSSVALLHGLVAILAALIVLTGLDVLFPLGDADFWAPRRIIFAAGLLFVLLVLSLRSADRAA